MKIATFNVNGISARLPRLLEWLANAQPDVACLQELKAPSERSRAAGFEAAFGASSSHRSISASAERRITSAER